MANQEHLDILAKGVDAWNTWRKENTDIQIDLRNAKLFNANLIGANLRGADLLNANLEGANLTGANLNDTDLAFALLYRSVLTGANLGANLTNANLAMANLTGANLYGAHLNDANLFNANLTDANLCGAHLEVTNLHGAHLDSTYMGSTVLANVNLSATKGLDTVYHRTPSTIGLDTIYRSGGKIPEIFLRGAGVPENFITYMKSLTGAAFDFYSCFISYSTKDQKFADRLHADLQARAVRCWFAPHDIQGGRKIHEQIDEAIKVYDKLLLILSDHSMNSNWVKTEIANARAKEEQQKRQMLFPISVVPFDQVLSWKLFDADTGIDSAREIREYFIPDFSNWKDHDVYARTFDLLVRDLKAQPGDKTATQPVL